MSSTTAKLTDAARILRNAAPGPFRDFYSEFAAYTQTKAKTLLFGTGDITLAQGHAQQCQAILDVLEKAENNG